MKDRLLKFMNNEELSSARFAELIGVQPSSISHVLSGRNKPGFDFIQKILGNFPSLSAEWLIMGRGDMYRELPNEHKTVQRDLFTDIGPDTDIKEGNDDEGVLSGTGNEESENSFEEPIGVTNVNKNEITDDYKSGNDNKNEDTYVNYKRSIEKIVIFYSDNTFSSYSPE